MIILTLVAKMIVSSAILYGYYWMFLRNKKFHHYNRFYLLAATAISIVIPFIKIPVFFQPGTTGGEIVYKSIDIISVNRWEDEAVENTMANTLTSLVTTQTALIILYGTGVFILIYFLGRSLIYIHNLSKKYPHEYINSLKLYNTTEPGTPFSFFRSIFWNRRLDLNSEEGKQIFRHEIFHVKQHHSADILFLECVSIFLWFNPIFHVIKREIKAIHEFLADQHSVSENNKLDYAELLIIQSINSKRSPLSNYFFQTHIKRRIAMITDLKTKKYNYWTRIMVLPLCVVLFCAVALYAKTPVPPIKKQVHEIKPQKLTELITVLVDAGHGGQDAGAKNADGLLEKDLALAIARQIKQHASSYNINVEMTRNDDSYPSLKERSEMANTLKAHMIISVHIGATENENTNSGFDFFVTNRNQQTVQQSTILAQNIANQIKELYAVGPIKQRKESGIWILDAVTCPAVLIECGYITSKKDVTFISSPENQEKIAKSILEGIVRYMSAEKVIAQPDATSPEKSVMNIQNEELNETLIAEESHIIQDTVPGKKKREMRDRELLQIRKQELELAHRKMNEAREMELKNQQRIHKLQQQELALQKRQMNEAKALRLKHEQELLKQRQQIMALRKRDMDEGRIAEISEKERAIREGQKETEIKQRMQDEVRQAEIRDKQRALIEEQREIEIKQRMTNEAKQAEMENRERTLIRKQEENELKRRKIEEQRTANRQNEQHLRLKKQESELEHLKNEEDKLREIDDKNPLPADQEPKPQKTAPAKKKPQPAQKPKPVKKEF